MNNCIQFVTNNDWFDPVITVVSVLVGAGLAYFTTNRFEQKKLKQEQLATAYSIIFKVQKMLDDLLKIEMHLDETKKEASAAGVEGSPWSTMTDIIGFTNSDISVNADELALIAVTKDSDLVMKVRELESGHGSILSALRKLGELRDDLARSGLITHVDGQTFSFEASELEYAQIAPTLINLETLANSLTPMLPRLIAAGKETAHELGPHLKKHYKFEHFITLSFPELQETEHQAN